MLLRINFRKCVERKGAWGPDVWPASSSTSYSTSNLIFNFFFYFLSGTIISAGVRNEIKIREMKMKLSLVNPWDERLAEDNRLLNAKSSYSSILMAPPCRLLVTSQRQSQAASLSPGQKQNSLILALTLLNFQFHLIKKKNLKGKASVSVNFSTISWSFFPLNPDLFLTAIPFPIQIQK